MIPKLPHHLLEDVLEEIRIFVENIIESIGVHGHTVPVMRHVLLTLVAILLAFIAEPCLGDMAVDAACLLSVPCCTGGFDTNNSCLPHHSDDTSCDETHRPSSLSQHETR